MSHSEGAFQSCNTGVFTLPLPWPSGRVRAVDYVTPVAAGAVRQPMSGCNSGSAAAGAWRVSAAQCRRLPSM